MKSTAKTRILAALRAGAQTTATLCQPDCGGVRFGARIMELRDDGHNILAKRVRDGSHRYSLGTESWEAPVKDTGLDPVGGVASLLGGSATLFDAPERKRSFYEQEEAL